MILRKLFGRKKGGHTNNGRDLVAACDLLPGDLVTFKHRQIIPPELQGNTFEITEVGTYQFEDGQRLELSLLSEDKSKYFMGVNPHDRHADFDLSINIPRKDVLTLFDETNFSDLWDEDVFSELEIQHILPRYDGWLCEKYTQVLCNGTGYFHSRDGRSEELSMYEEDGSEEFRYHEAEGSNDSYAITVEIWGDGDTDVTADVSCPSDAIDKLWPGN